MISYAAFIANYDAQHLENYIFLEKSFNSKGITASCLDPGSKLMGVGDLNKITAVSLTTLGPALVSNFRTHQEISADYLREVDVKVYFVAAQPRFSHLAPRGLLLAFEWGRCEPQHLTIYQI
jgi:hypothetical protein